MMRHKFLSETISNLPLEDEANLNAKYLVGVTTGLFLTFSILELLTYLAYNKWVGVRIEGSSVQTS